MQTLPLNLLCEAIFTGIPPRLKADDGATAFLTIPVIGIRAISTDGDLNLAAIESLSMAGGVPASARHLTAGDVLLTIRGSLPKCTLIEADFSNDTFASGNLATLRPDQSKLYPAYLWAVMRHICLDTHHPLLTRATTAQLSIRISDLSALKIPLPPFADQRAIGHAALALRNVVQAQRDALVQGERTLRAFLADTFATV